MRNRKKIVAELIGSATSVCHECGSRFHLGKYSNQHRSTGGTRHPARYCSGRCRQNAYRKRNAMQVFDFRDKNSVCKRNGNDLPGSYVRASVTMPLQPIENKGEFSTQKNVEHPVSMSAGKWAGSPGDAVASTFVPTLRFIDRAIWGDLDIPDFLRRA